MEPQDNISIFYFYKKPVMKKIILILISLLISIPQFSQHQNGFYPGRSISFPDILGYKTLITDLHMHTVLSDGFVWPSVRVDEAVRDGIDVISITDHIEYQPHSHDIPHPDRNRPFEIAKKAADGKDLIVINGAEVTRNMPPGHANAIFLSDVNKLNINDSVQAFREAKKQGAFIFWNHPNWIAQYPDGVAKLTDLHKDLINDGMLNGIEVVNDVTYSDEALQIALDYNLTILGTSDIHGLVDWQYDVPDGGHRPVTLVFAKEKTEEGLKEALFAGRTVVFFNNLLIGKPEYLIPLIEAGLETDTAKYRETWAGTTKVATFILKNKSDAPLILENRSQYELHLHSGLVVVDPNSAIELQVKTMESINKFEMRFSVLNAITAPKTHPEISFKVFVDLE